MSDQRWLDDREQRAWRSLMTMQADLSQYIERQLRQRSGLSSADYQVLAHLSEAPEGRLRAFALGDLLRWEKSRLSQHLTRMEKRGLVGRERCAADQRGAVLVITPQGRELIEAAAAPHVSDVRKVLIDHLTPEQFDLICGLGDQVRARLAELEQEP
ncbi:MAG TPA: MarR family winged helix-turn-helix transcriptional regulator [Arthrobacter sp.]